MKVRAMPENADSPLAYFLASSLQSASRLENGESKTTQPISWLASAYMRAVTAPILLPQIPMLLTVSCSLKYLKTVSTSSLSWYPREIYSPSDNPHPEKSKANRLASWHRTEFKHCWLHKKKTYTLHTDSYYFRVGRSHRGVFGMAECTVSNDCIEAYVHVCCVTQYLFFLFLCCFSWILLVLIFYEYFLPKS